MDETYRMLGAEHEADLASDAAKWRLATEARKAKPAARQREKRGTTFGPRVMAFFFRVAPGRALDR
jgi:hypothetical protein